MPILILDTPPENHKDHPPTSTGVCCLYKVIVLMSYVLLAKEGLTCFDIWQATQESSC